MSLSVRTAMLAGMVLAGLAAAGCQTPGPSAAVAVDVAACEREAGRLMSPVEVRAAPDAAAPLLAALPAGRFVYRCGGRGGWAAIMFPAAGEPVDCLYRGPRSACATGWVRGTVSTELFG